LSDTTILQTKKSYRDYFLNFYTIFNSISIGHLCLVTQVAGWLAGWQASRHAGQSAIGNCTIICRTLRTVVIALVCFFTVTWRMFI